jgi:hypothetical protein
MDETLGSIPTTAKNTYICTLKPKTPKSDMK